MELFERIRYISSNQRIPLAKFAEFIGVSPQAFNKWLNAKSQKNLWEHLPKILELLPEVNRHWLFFGEGDPFGEEAPVPLEVQTEITRLRAELEEERRINRQLVTKLLVDGAGDKGAQTNIARTADGA